MVEKKYKISLEGLEKKKKEYEELVTVKRKEVSQRIKEAKDFGDLSENAEYDEARKEQAEIEDAILKLEREIEQAEVIDKSKISTSKVAVGTTVLLEDKTYDEEVTYSIVGESEADPFKGLLSASSPVGLALLDRKKGETVKVDLPGGVVEEYKILKITK